MDTNRFSTVLDELINKKGIVDVGVGFRAQENIRIYEILCSTVKLQFFIADSEIKTYELQEGDNIKIHFDVETGLPAYIEGTSMDDAYTPGELDTIEAIT